MKTTAMSHQTDALNYLDSRRWGALFMEQGTGKTWVLLADAERCYQADKIDAVVVVAPNGVHTNWSRREIPKHMTGPVKVWAYRAGRSMEGYKMLMKDATKSLKILCINLEALCHKEGFLVVSNFMKGRKVMLIIDESHRIKSPTATVTKRVQKLGLVATCRRISTGTPLTNSPPDLYSQFEFMKPGFWNKDYRNFVARYAKLMPDHTGIMRHIAERAARSNPWAKKAQELDKAAKKAGTWTPETAKWHGPQMVQKDADGRPQWRNLEELRSITEAVTFRVLKKDCLDLPDKIYRTITFELSPAQRAAYEQIKRQHFLEVGGDLLEATALTSRIKMQQITSGFVLFPDGRAEYIATDNPRLEALKNLIEDQQGQFIVWAHFKEEIRAIHAMLTEMGITSCQYHGDISKSEREIAVDGFQAGKFRVFIGQAASGGVGLTLTAAERAIYFSQSYNWGSRSQSEDRNHRIGTEKSVLYINLVAEDTVDEEIAIALEWKGETASTVLGDDRPVPYCAIPAVE
jgi:SNF2 family DNA or RNA helicase